MDVNGAPTPKFGVGFPLKIHTRVYYGCQGGCQKEAVRVFPKFYISLFVFGMSFKEGFHSETSKKVWGPPNNFTRPLSKHVAWQNKKAVVIVCPPVYTRPHALNMWGGVPQGKGPPSNNSGLVVVGVCGWWVYQNLEAAFNNKAHPEPSPLMWMSKVSK